MCGLCGVAGPGIISADLADFEELLHLSMLRGSQGTGVARINSWNNETKISKSTAMSPIFLAMDYQEKKPIISGLSNTFFMGHCRAPTKGVVTEDNCHPFDVGNLIGTHNGTLVDAVYQDQKMTDSEMLYRNMAVGNLKKIFERMSHLSAFALSFYDKRDRTLNFIRNSERPLYITFHKTRNVMFYASEKRMLEFVLGSNYKTIYHAIPGTLYSIRPEDICREKEFDNWEIKEFNLKEKEYGLNYHQSYMHDWDVSLTHSAKTNIEELPRFLTEGVNQLIGLGISSLEGLGETEYCQDCGVDLFETGVTRCPQCRTAMYKENARILRESHEERVKHKEVSKIQSVFDNKDRKVG
jgi:glucosamine 6-phosphate synthetase-like amidotransferase/phosphosugar isomerase protein